MAGTDEKGGLGPAPNSDPAASTKDPKAVPSRRAPAARRSDPDQLAADIERTREDLAETLDAIAEKVSPKRVAKRTTKKVATAVRGTASEAAASVKGSAASARSMVTGAARDDTGWAPDPGPGGAAASLADVSGTSTMALDGAGTYRASGSLIRPQYVAAGMVAAGLAWLLWRRRNR